MDSAYCITRVQRLHTGWFIENGAIRGSTGLVGADDPAVGAAAEGRNGFALRRATAWYRGSEIATTIPDG